MRLSRRSSSKFSEHVKNGEMLVLSCQFWDSGVLEGKRDTNEKERQKQGVVWAHKAEVAAAQLFARNPHYQHASCILYFPRKLCP